MLLVHRLLESGYIVRHETTGGIFLNGMKSNPDYLTITPAGREFVQSLGLHEL
jgi:hypothetical protein